MTAAGRTRRADGRGRERRAGVHTFPHAHWTQIYSTNPLERLNAEIKRRTNFVGIFPNDASIVRLVAAMMLEQNDEWSLNLRYTRPGTRPKRPMVRGAACATCGNASVRFRAQKRGEGAAKEGLKNVRLGGRLRHQRAG